MQFTQGAPGQGGKCLEIFVAVGECWGKDSDNDGYDCMGLCGPGCQAQLPGMCSNWSRNCLRHDVCSYYYNSKAIIYSKCAYYIYIYIYICIHIYII